MRMPIENKATELLKNYVEAYERRDISQMMSLFTKNGCLWGTAQDEYRTGIQEIEAQHLRDWSQSEKGTIKIKSITSNSPDDLWTAAICKALVTIQGKEHIFDDLRGTIVIQKEEGRWKICHMHASFPDFRNPEGNSFPAA